MSDLRETLSSIEQVEGWMTDAQAELLWTSAAGLAGGARIVEIGSYHGRSAIVLARAAAATATVTAIDPHAGNDRGPQQIEGTPDEGEADHRRVPREPPPRRASDAACATCACPPRTRSGRWRATSTCCTWTAPTGTRRPVTTSPAGASGSAPAGCC